MKRMILLFVLVLAVESLHAQVNPSITRHQYFTTTWDSIYIGPIPGRYALIDLTYIAGVDTLFIARNNDTSATQRLRLIPGTTKYVPWPNVRYIKIKASADSVKAIVEIN